MLKHFLVGQVVSLHFALLYFLFLHFQTKNGFSGGARTEFKKSLFLVPEPFLTNRHLS